MNKFISIEEAVGKVKDGMTIMIGGFLANGAPNTIIDMLVKCGVKDLTLICNDTTYPDKGLGQLIVNNQVKHVITSYIGANPACSDKMNAGEMKIEFVPQGSLAERIRCGGSGLGGFLTQTGMGTIVAEGKPVIESEGKKYLLEKPLRADMALVYASLADESGNLIYKGTLQNFNPLMASAADVVIAEVGEVVKTGTLAPEHVKTPAIFVDFMVRHEGSK